MKRLLSVLLSFSVLCGFAPSRVDAKTNFINNNRAYIYRSKDGERVWIQGDGLPYINIKNKPVANANSTSSASSSSSGSSKIETGLKLLLLGVVLWYGIKLKNWLGDNSLTNGVKKVFSIPGKIMNGVGSLWTGACAGASKIFNGFNFWGEGNGDEDHEVPPEGSEENTTESYRESFLDWGKIATSIPFIGMVFSDSGLFHK